MKRERTIALVVAVMVVGGCGDPLADLSYRGDPLAVIQGHILLADPSQVPENPLGVLLGWRVERTPTDTWRQQNVDPSAGFPARYRLDLLTPPPDDALGVDPETGGRLGFAAVVLYEDVNHTGEPEFDHQDSKGLPTGPDVFRGGGELIFLCYAGDFFPATSRVGGALGGAVESGYHLVQAGEEYRCIWDEDRQDWLCPNSKTVARQVPLDTPVDLKAIGHPSQWSPGHLPDWLFIAPE
jgi:hypothetical protein